MTSYINKAIDAAEATEMLKEMLNVGKVSEKKDSLSIHGMNGIEDISSRRKDSDPFVTRQQIVLQGTEDTFSFSIEGEQVTFVCSPSDHTSGSSKVKIKNIVNFGWESKYYHGKLVAVHLFGVYFAYAIKTSQKEAAVRVINRNLDSRTLLKGMKGSIQDLSFAHGTSEVILAAVDEEGNLYVYEIKDDGEKVLYTPLLIIWSTEAEKHARIHLLKWCPYIPENPPDEYDESLPKLLLATHDNMASLWSVGVINKLHGCGPFDSSDFDFCGRMKIQDHSEAIIEALISPDGSAVATASSSGAVNFFQLNSAENETCLNCIHNWKPHNGKPLTCLVFLDDFKKPHFDAQFWKYSITGTDNNCELKVWSCETWNCLQTLRFEPPVGDTVTPCMKPYLDLSASYLLLSDIARRNLYVLQIQQDLSRNVVSVCCISEFPFNYPIVSIAILDAGRKKYKMVLDAENVFESSDYDKDEMPNSDGIAGEDGYSEGIAIKLLLIQPKSLQECTIMYQPASYGSDSAWSGDTMSQDSLMVTDRLSDVSMPITTPLETSSSSYTREREDHSLTPAAASHSFSGIKQQLLLTPDSFTAHSLPASVAKPNPTVSRLNVSLDSALGALSALNHTSAASIAKSENLLVDISEDSAPDVNPKSSGLVRNKSVDNDKETAVSSISAEDMSARFKKASNSTGSSPSLEVQEILAPRSDDGKAEGGFFGSPSQKNGGLTVKATLGVTDMIRLSSPEKCAASEKVRRASLPPPTTRMSASPHSSHQIHNTVSSTANQVANDGGEAALYKQVLNVTGKIEHLEHNFNSLAANMQQQNVELVEMMKAVTTSMNEKNMILETLLRNHEGRVLSALSQTVNNSIITKLESVVNAEFKNTILPGMNHMVELLNGAIQAAVSQKLTATDIQMKDAITKLIKSKPTMDAIGNATALQLQHIVGSTFKDVCHVAVIPAFEKAVQAMLAQVNDSIQKGFKEYCINMDSVLNKRLAVVNQSLEVAEAKLCSAAASVQSTSTNLNTIATSIKSEMNVQIDEKLTLGLAKLEDNLVAKIQKTVRDTVTAAFKEQAISAESVVSSIRSRSVTPVVDAHVHQMQISQLLRSGNYNAAFEQALSISDLNMVVYTCKQIEPAKVFSHTPCVLQQPVLLALIQQLAVDLFTNTELKLKYIEEAITQLDKLHPATCSHIAKILKGLQGQLQAFLVDNPTTEHRTKVRMLVLATAAQLAEL